MSQPGALLPPPPAVSGPGAPPRRGMRPWVIVLIVVGVLILLLFGACGVLVYQGFRAMNVQSATVPADLPVYPGAVRQMSLEMAPSHAGVKIDTLQWLTKDTPDKVRTFYLDRLNQGDWKLTETTGRVTFRRRSNTNVQGLLRITPSLAQTVIQVQLIDDSSGNAPGFIEPTPG